MKWVVEWHVFLKGTGARKKKPLKGGTLVKMAAAWRKNKRVESFLINDSSGTKPLFACETNYIYW